MSSERKRRQRMKKMMYAGQCSTITGKKIGAYEPKGDYSHPVIFDHPTNEERINIVTGGLFNPR